MNKSVVYLIYFFVYSIILLILGKNSFKQSDTLSKFYIGERSLSLTKCIFTFAGTWVSAATILGFTGNVYESGYAALMYSVIPWFIGAIFLICISDRLYDNDILTIPEFFRKRYNSKGLQMLVAIVMICVYVFYLVIQIKGFGIVASNLFGIKYEISIMLVYLFILYSTFGGYYTVTKTDGFNLIILSISIIVIYTVIVKQAGGVLEINRQAFFISGKAHSGMTIETGQGDLLKFFGKGQHSPLMNISMFCGWGLGLAANPQYAVRMISAQNKKTAKKTIMISLVFLSFLYFALIQIGLGIRTIYPSLDMVNSTDEILIYVINNLMYTNWSGFFLISIIGACVSTANSQLLLIASSFSYDLINTLNNDRLPEERLLNLNRIGIFIGGTFSLLLSLNPPPNLLSYGGDIWGIFGTTLFPTLYGTLLFKNTTKTGVYASMITGILCNLIFYNIPMPMHPSFPSVVVSSLTFVAVCKLTYNEREDKVV